MKYKKAPSIKAIKEKHLKRKMAKEMREKYGHYFDNPEVRKLIQEMLDKDGGDKNT